MDVGSARQPGQGEECLPSLQGSAKKEAVNAGRVNGYGLTKPYAPSCPTIATSRLRELCSSRHSALALVLEV